VATLTPTAPRGGAGSRPSWHGAVAPPGDDDAPERALAEERLGRRPRGASRLAQWLQATGPSVPAAFQHEAVV
jgi:hypothetical protein